MKIRFGWVVLALASFVLNAGILSAQDLQISPASQTVCSSDVAQFTAEVGTNAIPPIGFTWSGPNGFFVFSSSSNFSSSITVSNVGKYSVTVSDAVGHLFGPACAPLNVKTRLTVETFDKTLTCDRPQVVLSATAYYSNSVVPSMRSSPSNAVYSWSGPGIISGGDTATPVVNQPGTYTVTVAAANGCSTVATADVRQDTTAPTLTVAVPDVLTCTRTQVVLVASSMNAIAFTWSGPGIVGASNGATCTVNQPGTYTVMAANRRSGFAMGIIAYGSINMNGSNVVVDPFNPLTNYFHYTNLIINPLLTNDVIYSDGIFPVGPIVHPPVLITDTCAEVPDGVTINPDGLTNTPPHFTYGGHYSFHYDEVLSTTNIGGNGCSTMATVVVQQDLSPLVTSQSKDVRREFITLGQGFWANPDRKFNRISSYDLAKSLLTNLSNQTSRPFVLGEPGRSLTIPWEAAWWFRKRLPADGTARALPTFGDQVLSAASGQTSPMLPTSPNARFNNALLGNTIALTLEVRMDQRLGDFELSQTLCTKKALAGSDKLMGTADDTLNVIARAGKSDPDKHRFQIPSPVFDALCDAHLPYTVAGLLELANHALAGQPTGSASAADINAAILLLEGAFHDGRYCVSP